MELEVRTRSVTGRPAAIGSSGAHTLVIDRSLEGGGDGLGFDAGELLYLAVAGCVSNDLSREASAMGIALSGLRVRVSGSFAGEPAVSREIGYEVEIEGEAEPQRLRELVAHVDRIAEIPNTLRGGANVSLRAVQVS